MQNEQQTLSTIARSIFRTGYRLLALVILVVALAFFLFPTSLGIPLLLAGSYKLFFSAILTQWLYAWGLFVTLNFVSMWITGKYPTEDN